LRDLLTPVIPLAANDKGLPMLNAVLIQTWGNVVTALATDRYRAGISRMDLAADAEQEPFAALVRIADLNRIMTVFKPGGFENPVLEFTLAANTLHVASTEGFDGIVGGSLTFTTTEGEFPAASLTTMILATLEATPGADSLSVNASLFADFKHAVRDGASLVIRPGESSSKVISVTCGNHFVGAIMPRPLVGGNDSRAEWIKWLTPKPARKSREEASA